MSDSIAVFKAGVVQQLSTPAELYERPQNSFVASSSARTTAFPAPCNP
jgi:putative spermidine/putrescine transport system ATP-binding protein